MNNPCLACLGVMMPLALHAAGMKPAVPPPSASPPNVIIVLTDDQGFGDLSCHGNPVLKTPNLDKLHAQSIRLTDFHVAPMCTPTRGQLMTGRDCLANGAYVVCSGRSFVREEIPAMPEIFGRAGYRTGIFGKWHLGDNYPHRPQDRGFQEVLTFNGWGVGCAADHWNNAYQDCTFLRNGTPEFHKGYCTDVWFDNAMRWMESCAADKKPFLCYLPTNTPHGPAWVEERYAQPYLDKVSPPVAKFFGMIANLDENVGRLEEMLARTGLLDNTILIFMTDNGGTGGVKVFNAGMRGHKTEYYEGGHRVPCFIRWPSGGLRAPGDVSELAQIQDLLPTLLDLCGIEQPAGAAFDGASLAPLLRGKTQPELAARTLVVQYGIWQEWEGPAKWNAAVLRGKWRLVSGKELYDVAADPGQTRDVAAAHPEVVEQMRTHYEGWWAAIEPGLRDYVPIPLGSPRAETVCLASQDWAGYNTSNTPDIRAGVNRNGPWHVRVERAGTYEFSLRRWPLEAGAAIREGVPEYRGAIGGFDAGVALPVAAARLETGGWSGQQAVNDGDAAAVFDVALPEGPTTVRTAFLDAGGVELCGAYYVYVRRK